MAEVNVWVEKRIFIFWHILEIVKIIKVEIKHQLLSLLKVTMKNTPTIFG